MYYASLDDNRVIVQCNIANNGRMRFISAIYDTGARFTCFEQVLLTPCLKRKVVREVKRRCLEDLLGVGFRNCTSMK